MKQLLFIFSFIFFLAFTCFSQKPVRVEIEVKKGIENYHLMLCGRNGVVLFYENTEKKDNQKNWVLTKYDPNFNEEWSFETSTPAPFRYINHFHDSIQNKLFVFLGKIKYSVTNTVPFAGRGEYRIVMADLTNGKLTQYNGYIPVTSSINDFKVINDHAFLIGSNSLTFGKEISQFFLNLTLIPAFTGLSVFKYKPVIIQHDLNKNASYLIPAKYIGNAFPVSSRINYENNIPYLAVTIKNTLNKKESFLNLTDYDINGNSFKNINVRSVPDKLLTTGSYLKLDSNEAMLLGTYNLKSGGKFTFNPINNESTGMNNSCDGFYISKIIGEKQEYIKFYNLTKLQSFYNNVNPKNGMKMKDKARKAEEKGKELTIDYKMLVHDIIQKNNELVLIAEAYYPEYHTDCYWITDSYGRSYQQCRSVFDGYRFTNALVAAFNKDGDLLWDNSFEMMDILSFNLKEKVRVMLDSDDIIMAYSNNGQIVSKIIRNNEVLQGKEETPVETLDATDKVKNDYSSDMDYWYDNYFITYGYQRIADKTDKKRKIFYFNKVSFE